MKRVVLIVALLMVSANIFAQDCEVLVTPFFGGDSVLQARYPAEKFDYRCRYARNAFYFSDTIPAGAVTKSISEVVDNATGQNLPQNIYIDLSTFSYYAYSFRAMQHTFTTCNMTICFSTPGSEHPYLVLRSLDEIYFRTEFPERYN